MTLSGPPACCLNVLVSGRVQGVYFRVFTRQQAQAAGLTGWVRNLPDGRVEAVLQGPQSAVEQVLEALRQGPANARVSGIETRALPPDAFADFRIL